MDGCRLKSPDLGRSPWVLLLHGRMHPVHCSAIVGIAGIVGMTPGDRRVRRDPSAHVLAEGGELPPGRLFPKIVRELNREAGDPRVPRSQSRPEPLPEGKSLRDVASLGPLKAEEPPLKDRLPGGAANEPEDNFGAGLLS